MTGMGDAAAEIRARLDEIEQSHDGAVMVDGLAIIYSPVAALRAVLDLCDVEDRMAAAAEERPYLFVTEVRATIAEALGSS